MKSGIGKVKSFFAVLLITLSFSANSAMILDISGVTTGVFGNMHTIDQNSVVLTSNYGFSLSSLNNTYITLNLGDISLLNGSESASINAYNGTRTVVDDGSSHSVSLDFGATIYDMNNVTLYSGTLSIESEYFYAGEDTDGYGSFTMIFDDPSVNNPQPVPEPGVIGLLSLGLIGLGFARKRKQSQLK